MGAGPASKPERLQAKLGAVFVKVCCGGSINLIAIVSAFDPDAVLAHRHPLTGLPINMRIDSDQCVALLVDERQVPDIRVTIQISDAVHGVISSFAGRWVATASVYMKPRDIGVRRGAESPTGIEPAYAALQTAVLPLGHGDSACRRVRRGPPASAIAGSAQRRCISRRRPSGLSVIISLTSSW